MTYRRNLVRIASVSAIAGAVVISQSGVASATGSGEYKEKKTESKVTKTDHVDKMEAKYAKATKSHETKSKKDCKPKPKPVSMPKVEKPKPVEKPKVVEVKKEVVVKEVVKEVPKEVHIVKEVPKEVVVVKEVPKEVKVVKTVEAPVVKQVELAKTGLKTSDFAAIGAGLMGLGIALDQTSKTMRRRQERQFSASSFAWIQQNVAGASPL